MRKKYLFILGIFFISAINAQNLFINEVMSSNQTFISDSDKDYPDWIEIYNRVSNSINLNGYYLSDDKDDLLKWQFPSIIIKPDSFLTVFASGKESSFFYENWSTLVAKGDYCYFIEGEPDIPVDWIMPDFNTQNWSYGPSGVGYGDGDDNSIVEDALSVFIRFSFFLPDTSSIENIILHMDYDDGFVAYLNGIETTRGNMNFAGEKPRWNAVADSLHEARIYRNLEPEQFFINHIKPHLKIGENTLAVQVHNANEGSSDLSLITYLSVNLKENNAEFPAANESLNFPKSEIHSSFKISSSGESVYLADSSGLIINSINVPELPGDVSYGRFPDGAENYYYFLNGTPGFYNSSDTLISRAPKVLLDHNSGFYDQPFFANPVINDHSVNVHYTIDGSEPTKNSPLNEIGILVDKTMVVKTKSFKNGYLPGQTNSYTYLLNENVTLPVISLSTDPANLWDEQNGIYAMGAGAESAFPHFGANFWMDWERPAQIELIEDGVTKFNSGCGIKIFGGWSRGFPQKSISVFFRGEYGQNSLDFQLFDNQFDTYQAFVLRNSGNDWESTMMRDGLMHSLTSDMDIDHQEFKQVIVFLNGQYWGIHNIREKINEHYIETHHSVPADNIDMLENYKTVIHGDARAYNEFLSFLEQTDLSSQEAFLQIESFIDVNSYIDYQCAQIFFDNRDWPGNNIKFWRPREANGRWRWILFDTDFGFGLFDRFSYQRNTLEFALQSNGPEWPNPPWSTYVFRKLLENPEFERKFINRSLTNIELFLNTTLVHNKIDSLQNIIMQEINRHKEFWNQNPGRWSEQINILKEFATFRSVYMRSFIMREFDLNQSSLVEIVNRDSVKGFITIEDISLTNSFYKIPYLKNTVLHLQAISEKEYQFSHWLINGKTYTGSFLPLKLDSSFIKIEPFFTTNDTLPLVINEINYNSVDNYDSADWIELCNPNSFDISIENWLFRDDDNSHNFYLPQNAVITANGYVILVKDSTKFNTVFGSEINIYGNFQFGLSGGGELIRLFNAKGMLIDSLTYDDKAPWPEEADGFGHTLELKSPHLENHLAKNWAASKAIGTPGYKNSIVTMVETSDFIPEYFKLLNPAPNPFNSQALIRVDINRQGLCKLSLFDNTGRKVSEILNRRLSPGSYSFKFDSRGLASGIYFLQADFDNQKQTKKMVLIR